MIARSAASLSVLAQLLFLAPSARSESNDKALADRFVHEAPAKWADYLERARFFQGTMTEKVYDLLADRKLIFRNEQEIKQGTGGVLLGYQRFEGYADTRGRIESRNPRYGFQLYRSSPNAKYALTGVNPDLSRGFALAYWDPGFYVEKFIVSLPFSLTWDCYSNLQDMLAESDFHIANTESVLVAGEQLVRVHFHRKPKVVEERKIGAFVVPLGWSGVTEGTLVLDPAHLWVLRSFELQADSAGRERADGPWLTFHKGSGSGTMEYRFTPDGFPIPVRRSTISKGARLDSGAADSSEREAVFAFHEDRNVPDSEFLLSTYGFPGPPGEAATARPIRWHLWLGGAAVLCFALAIASHQLKRRHALLQERSTPLADMAQP